MFLLVVVIVGDVGACTYHGGRGSLELRLEIREPSERVSWTSRWRDCSRTFIWSWLRLDIMYGSWRSLDSKIAEAVRSPRRFSGVSYRNFNAVVLMYPFQQLWLYNTLSIEYAVLLDKTLILILTAKLTGASSPFVSIQHKHSSP